MRYIAPSTVAVVAAAGMLGCWRGQRTAGASSRHALVADMSPSSCNADGDAVALSIIWVDSASIAFIDTDSEQVVICGVGSPLNRRLGRRGSGPGEFTGAYVLLGGADHRILVGDIGANSVTALSASGGYEASARIPGLPSHLLAAKGDSVWLVWSDGNVHMAPTIGTLFLANGNTHALFRLVSGDADGGNAIASSRLFAVASANGRSFYYADIRRYAITQATPSGGTLKTFGRPDLPIEYPTETEIEARLAMMEGLARARGMALPAPMIKSFSEAMRHQANPLLTMQSLAIGPRGELWVITRRHVGDSSDVDVFRSDGSLAKTYVLRDTVRAIAFQGNRLAALVARADVGRPQSVVDIYRIDSLDVAQR